MIVFVAAAGGGIAYCTLFPVPCTASRGLRLDLPYLLPLLELIRKSSPVKEGVVVGGKAAREIGRLEILVKIGKNW